MARVHERINGALGRLVFGAFGLLCALVALVCAYAVWTHISNWQDYSLVPTILFAIAALAAGSCVPYCFSRERTFIEALDAMEGGVGDTRKWDKKAIAPSPAAGARTATLKPPSSGAGGRAARRSGRH